ncbi:signal peptidase II [Streptomyces sp. NPDC004542]|uniref:signal peptidase II n=1 Tax=Streptomyces sp. NPDC004542 TaxID=3154281 RepID=UPI0033B169E5
MAEAEHTIGTPDTSDAAGAGPDETAASAASTATAAERPRGRRRIAVLFSVAAFAYALDLASKLIVVAKLEHHAPVKVFGEWLEFTAIRNAGAAFSFGQAYTVIFTVIAAAVIVVIVRLARKLYSLPWAIALGLLLGGALGNLTDRVFRSPGIFQGEVIDFIAPKGFAVFNLADSAIVCGGVLIVLLSFRGLDPDGTVHKD